jgi:DNA repair protein RecN (Recombination protein N)
MVFQDRARARLVELQGFDQEAGRLEGELAVAREELQGAEERVGAARRAVAPQFAGRVEAALQGLAMPAARFAVDIGPELSGNDVAWLLGANPGEPLLPLVKVASGGELARTMLAVRLVLTERRTARADRPRPDGGEPAEVAADRAFPADGDSPGDLDPPTLVFDEVDAGIGGQAAVAVGQALAALARDHQVLVVTHLPQVAACADRHLVVRKRTKAGRTSASVEEVEGPARVVELSRMLSGRPDSPTARRHAEELLAQRQR